MEGTKPGTKTPMAEEALPTPMVELAWPDPELTSEQHLALGEDLGVYPDPNMNPDMTPSFHEGEEQLPYWHFFRTFELMSEDYKTCYKELKDNAGKWDNRFIRRKMRICCYCQKLTNRPKKKSSTRKVNSRLNETLEDLEKLRLSSGLQNADDIWKNLEAFEKLKLSECQNAGATSQEF